MRPRVVALFVCALFCAGSVLRAQHTPITAASPDTGKSQLLTNADIIAMATAGLDDSIIVDKIHSTSSRSFDTSVEGLKSLRAANVSNNVIREMMSGTLSADAAASSNDPGLVHPPGVYVMVFNHDGSSHLVMLEHTRAIGDKISGNSLAMAYGLGKRHTKQSLNGPRSPVQLEDANPTFYIYIPEDTQSFGGSDLSARDFELVKLHVGSATREVEISSMGNSGMGVSGVQDKARQITSVSKLKTGIYTVKLAKPLKPGEYAFQHELDGIFYDFGVREAR